MKKIINFIVVYILPVWEKTSIWYLKKKGYKITKK